MERQAMLFDAASSENLSAVKFWYFLGADLDRSPDDDYGGAPEPNFLAAVDNGHEDMVRFSIEHHSDIEATYSDIQSPLEAAIGDRNYSMTELLLKNGAKLRKDWIDPTNWRPPLDDKMVELLRRYAESASGKKVSSSSTSTR
ncbi:MAG TPA: ankyrin repeat domain-containing protein [Chthoniobacteraceae bacterium]|jgi:ankyrin repeat protein|nr:ankyrin repeat domain-containing protein [Chthoniobacteraceae bacterium]